MRIPRRAFLAAAALPGWALAQHAAPPVAADADTEAGIAPRPLVFPRDFGAHPRLRTEWWYATGTLQTESGELLGFQLTFFRSRTGLAQDDAGRFAPRQLLSAHAALSELQAGTLHHAQRLARWNEAPDAKLAAASVRDTDVAIGDWFFRREGPLQGSRYRARLADRDAGFAYEIELAATQPLLLQGDAGFSRKGPQASQASHYYSQPQLAVTGTLWRGERGQRRDAVRGKAWLDHEWSEALLHPQAVGWDWIGMNLDDGSALTAFRLRRADGSALWAGGSFRRAGERDAQAFGPEEVRFTPGRTWASPSGRARYPVEWTIDTPAGRFTVHALLDAQELDSRSSTGAVYWEGLSELRDATGGRVGRGYLEMTGYASPLRLG